MYARMTKHGTQPKSHPFIRVLTAPSRNVKWYRLEIYLALTSVIPYSHDGDSFIKSILHVSLLLLGLYNRTNYYEVFSMGF